MSAFTMCRDGHHCDNGSLCTENPMDEGAYYCDCDATNLKDAVAGLSCEHVATSYCTFNKEFSSTSFCTNGGTCKAEVSAESAHLGCTCPADYTGDHCQFVAGVTIPDNWPGATNTASNSSTGSSSNEKLSGGVTAVIVLIVLGFVSVVGYLIYIKKRRSSRFRGTEIHSPECQLDADGEVLKEAVLSGAGVNSNGGSDLSLEPIMEENASHENGSQENGSHENGSHENGSTANGSSEQENETAEII